MELPQRVFPSRSHQKMAAAVLASMTAEEQMEFVRAALAGLDGSAPARNLQAKESASAPSAETALDYARAHTDAPGSEDAALINISETAIKSPTPAGT